MPTRDPSPDVGLPLTIEVGREFDTTCEQCGRSAASTTGFVYRGGDALAVYHTTLHRHAGIPRADIGIGIGEWRSETSVADASAFLAVWPELNEIRFDFVDPAESVWAHAKLFANQLTAAAARDSHRRAEFLRVAEGIVRDDQEVARHLSGT